MVDTRGQEKCIICHPELKPRGTSQIKFFIEERVGYFENDASFLNYNHEVLFLWVSDPKKRQKMHKVRLDEFGRLELYWLLKAAIQMGQKFAAKDDHPDVHRQAIGYNLGKEAGQSLPHIHAQTGWELVIEKGPDLHRTQIEAYFDELQSENLIIYRSDQVIFFSPYVPKGAWEVDLAFVGKFNLTQLDESDMRIFSVLGQEIVRKYIQMGIRNMNIFFTSACQGGEDEMLIAHFVPRLNTPAFNELRDCLVIDIPPVNAAEEFRRHLNGKSDWGSFILRGIKHFDPDSEFEQQFDANENTH